VVIVAVDAGRTNCRAAVFTAAAGGQPAPGAPVALASAATIVDPDGPARVAATIRRAVARLGGPLPDARLAVAAAGALWRPAATALAERLAAAHAEVAVTSDVVAAHAGAFGGGPGVVLAVGTGAVALAVGEDRGPALVDGRGYLVGDAGGGFAIGRAGLVAALRHGDGRAGGSATLAAAAQARFGPLDELPYRLHAEADAPRQVASFVPEVAAAARAGDSVARAIWRDAAAELATTVTAACAAAGEACPVALVGSMFDIDDLLTAPLRALLADHCPKAMVYVGSPDALAGAARLAGGPVPAYEPLVVRRNAP
jgi:N-acetylglucosamine kinase-like BadF-type ATPase